MGLWKANLSGKHEVFLEVLCMQGKLYTLTLTCYTLNSSEYENDN